MMLLGGSIFPVVAQTSPNSPDHVVINEIDTNPMGSDTQSISEWVELFNPTNEAVDIGNWKIASTTVVKKTLVIPSGTTIDANGFRTFIRRCQRGD